MEEKKFVKFKEEELSIKEYIKKALGKGRISDVLIEYTPVGEKIIVATNKPGLIIGRRGEKINELTTVLKKRFNLDNPHIEIKDILDSNLDPQLVADGIALNLEKKGSTKFKLIVYRLLKDIMASKALGVEVVLAGKLPSDRARTWRFAQGYLKKTGEPAKVVRRAIAQAKTQKGVIGIKVSILPPDAKIHDQIIVNEELKNKIILNISKEINCEKESSVKKMTATGEHKKKKEIKRKSVNKKEKEKEKENGDT